MPKNKNFNLFFFFQHSTRNIFLARFAARRLDSNDSTDTELSFSSSLANETDLTFSSVLSFSLLAAFVSSPSPGSVFWPPSSSLSSFSTSSSSFGEAASSALLSVFDLSCFHSSTRCWVFATVVYVYIYIIKYN